MDTDASTPANPPRRKAAMGKIAFDAYTASVGGVTHDGKPIPGWLDLTDEVRAGWSAAAIAVREDVLRPADVAPAAPAPENAGPPLVHQG